MGQFSFVFTIFFMLLGPIKIIPAFVGLTQGTDDKFRRAAAIRAAIIASIVVILLAAAGGNLVTGYRISIDGVRIAGGLVLLLAALNTIFANARPPGDSRGNATPLQLAVSQLERPATFHVHLRLHALAPSPGSTRLRV